MKRLIDAIKAKFTGKVIDIPVTMSGAENNALVFGARCAEDLPGSHSIPVRYALGQIAEKFVKKGFRSTDASISGLAKSAEIVFTPNEILILWTLCELAQSYAFQALEHAKAHADTHAPNCKCAAVAKQIVDACRSAMAKFETAYDAATHEALRTVVESNADTYLPAGKARLLNVEQILENKYQEHFGNAAADSDILSDLGVAFGSDEHSH